MCSTINTRLDGTREQSENIQSGFGRWRLPMQIANDSADLFRHVSAEKAAFYRCIMDVFAAAKRQYRLQLRPDEVLAEARWPDGPPRIEEVNAALAQLDGLGQPRIASRHGAGLQPQRLLPRPLSLPAVAGRRGGRIGAGGLRADPAAPRRTADGGARRHREPACRPCRRWPAQAEPDVAKVHETLRDLVRVFEGLAENAQAFMAGVARSIELQQAEAGAVASYKRRLIDYLERFMGDLVRRSDTIARLILALEPRIDALLRAGGRARSARCGARRRAGPGRCARPLPGRPGANAGRACAAGSSAPATSRRRPNCCGRGRGRPSRSCWPRSPRSTSGAAAAATARPISACSPAGSPPAQTTARRTGWRAPPSRSIRRGISRSTPTPTPSCRPAPPGPTPPPLRIHPRLREYGEAAPRGPLPRVRDRAEERALLARQLAEESRQVEAARRRLATGQPARLSDLGELDMHAFGLFLGLLGEALAEQAGPDDAGGTADRRRPAAHPPGAARARQPRQDRHAARRLCRARSSDHHHAHAGRPMNAANGVRRRPQHRPAAAALPARGVSRRRARPADDAADEPGGRRFRRRAPPGRRAARMVCARDRLDAAGRARGRAPLQAAGRPDRRHARPARLRPPPLRAAVPGLRRARTRRPADHAAPARASGCWSSPPSRRSPRSASPSRSRRSTSGANWWRCAARCWSSACCSAWPATKRPSCRPAATQADALYDVQRRDAGRHAGRGARPVDLVAGRSARRRSTSGCARWSTNMCADSDEGRRTALRHQLARRLLDDPVVYVDNAGSGGPRLLRQPARRRWPPACARPPAWSPSSAPKAWRWSTKPAR